MKRILFILLMVALANISFSQSSKETEIILKKVADKILSENVREFVDSKTGEKYTQLKEDTDLHSLNCATELCDWEYPSGVLNIAMLELGKLFEDEKYINYSIDNYEFIFNNTPFITALPEGRSKWSTPFGQFITLEELDDCGAMGAGLIDVYRNYVKRDDYLAYINRAADHIMNKQDRLDDGTLCRKRPVKYTIWADDLYMGIPFLARMGKLTGEQKYFDDASKQVIQFNEHLWDEQTKLYAHCWQSDDSTNGVAHWGRANGWVIVAHVELLKNLPESHPQREKVLDILKQQINGVARYQSESGLWHQILDKQDSYLETSATAMFVFGIASAVNEGWIPERYISIALNGWDGLKTTITEDGTVKGICVGTGISSAIKHYYTRPTLDDDVHGLGPVIMAGIEIDKYLLNKGK